MKHIFIFLLSIFSFNIFGQPTQTTWPFVSIKDVPYQTLDQYKAPTQNMQKATMNIVWFYQLDPAWNCIQLGECTTNAECTAGTIGRSGCFLCCVAMVLNANGVNVDPAQLNTYLKSHSGYTSGGCDLIPSVACNYQGATINNPRTVAYSLALIKSEIDGGNPVIANVGGHYILIVGYNNQGLVTSDFLVNDPGRTDGQGRAFNNYTCSGLFLFSNVGYVYSYSISGNILNQTGTGLSGVTVTANNGGSTSTTSSTGYYSLEVPKDWTGIVTPVLSGYKIVPTNKSFTNVSSNQQNQNFTAYLPPIADFSGYPLSIKTGENVGFVDASTNNPTSWSWSFQGGTPSSSTSRDPIIVYNTAGTYNVTLEVTNAAGDKSTKSKTAYVTVSPSIPTVCDFTMSASQITKGESVTFTDISTNNPTSWSWTFEGGVPATSTNQNPVVQYNSIGKFSVTLKINNSISKTKTVTVVEKQWVVSGNTYNGVNILGGVTVTFDPGGFTTSNNDGYYTSSVKDGWSGTIKASKSGYTFTDIPLTINSNKTVNFYGSKAPVYTIQFTPNTPLSGQLVEFKLNSCGIDMYGLWDFGDGSELYDDNGLGKAKHAFNCYREIDEIYTIKCTVKKRNSTEEYIAQPVNINMPRCGLIVSAVNYTNGCTTARLGQEIFVIDASEPYSNLTNINVFWNGSGSYEDQYFTPISPNYAEYQKYPTNRMFSHLYPTKGHKAIKWQACTNGNDDISWIGFNIVDCNSTVYSNNLSNCTFDDWGGINRYFAGRIILAGSAGNYEVSSNKKIEFTACSEIILNPGFHSKPLDDNYLYLNANDPCLYNEGLKTQPQLKKEEIKTVNPTLLVYPNPTSTKITVEYSGDSNSILHIDIISSTGAVVLNLNRGFISKQEIDISHFSPGIYCIRLLINGDVLTKKIVKN